MHSAPFHPFLHEKTAWLSLLLTLASCCLMICDHTIWLSKNTTNTMPGFPWSLIWLARSWSRKSHTNISSVFLSCTVHNLQVSCSWKWSSNILFQSSWNYFNISTCDMHSSGGDPQFLLRTWRTTFFIPPSKGKIFYIPTFNSRRVYSDSGLLLYDNLSKIKLKPNIPSKTSIYIYIYIYAELILCWFSEDSIPNMLLKDTMAGQHTALHFGKWNCRFFWTCYFIQCILSKTMF